MSGSRKMAKWLAHAIASYSEAKHFTLTVPLSPLRCIEHFHMMSRKPCCCSKTMEWQSCWCKSLSRHTSQLAKQARAYPGFSSMKCLGVFLLPPGWDAGPSQGYTQQWIQLTYLHTWGAPWVKCLAQEHNTISLDRAGTQKACSGVKHTNHEATAPPMWYTKPILWELNSFLI